MTSNNTPKRGRVAIILHDGAYDRASCALSIALAALASNMDVHMMLTFGGLRRFTKTHINDLGEETPSGIRADLEWGIEAGPIQPLDKQLADAKSMGLKIYACPNTMACLRIPRHELLEVDEVLGLVAFLELSRTADMHWYI